MTIAAGFCCYDGIVIGVDSQETTGSMKVPRQKAAIRTKPVRSYIGSANVIGVLIGSGEAVFCDMVADELWSAIEGADEEIDSIVRSLKDRLVGLHERYSRFSTSEVSYEVDMLLGVYIKNQGCYLLHACGPAIAQVGDFKCIGAGLELGSYIAARMFNSSRSMDETAIISMYLLQQTKNYAQFCGGQSVLYTIGHGGEFQLVRAWVDEEVTAFLAKIEEMLHYMMIQFANVNSSEDDLSNARLLLDKVLTDNRAALKISARKRAEYLARAAAGKLKPAS